MAMIRSRAIDAEITLPVRKSLRARGWAATLALLAYVALSLAYITWERSKIADSIAQLDQLARHERALALAEAAVNAMLLDASELASAGQGEPAPPKELRLAMEAATRLFGDLEEFDPAYARLQRTLSRGYEALQAQPVRAAWLDMRVGLKRVADELEIRRRELNTRRERASQDYRHHYDAVTVESLALAAIGLVVFGTLAAWFFARLTRDVHRLERHARQIVRGRRGVTMEVNREDELGRLMHAVNRMAVDLDEREKRIELEGQRRSHEEKMAAVGALAAGMSHEVNNPLAVISGVAQELAGAEAPLPPDALAGRARLIVEQAQRAAQAARQLAEVATPQASELDWVDLDALLARAVQLMAYDKRYRPFVFERQAEPGLPAVRTSANAVQQVAMQMLSIGCQAMIEARAAPLRVRLHTGAVGDTLQVLLQFAAAIDVAAPPLERSLALARATLEPVGARLALHQDAVQGLRIKLFLPMGATGEAR